MSFQRVLKTGDDACFTLLRLMVGISILPHGLQKLMGWFGGRGFSGTLVAFTHQYGIPPALTVLVICIEVFGSLGLIFGLFGRVCALGTTAVMTGAMLITYGKYGHFMMNWFGAYKGEGIEYHLLALAAAIAVLVRGSGAFSVDRWLSAHMHREPRPLAARAAAF